MHMDVIDRMSPAEILHVRKVFRQATSIRDAARRLRIPDKSAQWIAERLQIPHALNSAIMGSYRAATNDMNMKGWRESDDAAERLMARIEGRMPLQARQQAQLRAERYGLAAMHRRVMAEAAFAAVAASEQERREAVARRALQSATAKSRRKRKGVERPDPANEIDTVIALACTFYQVAWADLAGPSHKAQLVQVRIAVSHACKALVHKASTLRIGKALNRDHSTIVNLLRKPREPFEPFIGYCREVLS